MTCTVPTPIGPGGFLNPPNPEAGPEITGGIQQAQIVAPYSGADIQGWLVSTVYSPDPFNPDGLTFTYQIVTDRSSTHAVESFTVGNYGPFMTDVSWDFAGGIPVPPPAVPPIWTVAPVYASRSISGDVISYNFSLFGNPGILPGEGSEILVVRTNAQFYEPTIASVINAGSAEVPSFAPVAVPEPASMALIGLVAGGIYFKRRFFVV